jgi:hypothetical protein
LLGVVVGSSPYSVYSIFVAPSPFLLLAAAAWFVGMAVEPVVGAVKERYHSKCIPSLSFSLIVDCLGSHLVAIRRGRIRGLSAI